jgi:hypothetical protein
MMLLVSQVVTNDSENLLPSSGWIAVIKMEAAASSATLVAIHESARCHSPEGHALTMIHITLTNRQSREFTWHM